MESNNYIEHGNERIPHKRRSTRCYRTTCGKYTIRELFDEKGLYLLEIKVEGKETAETAEYQFNI